MKELISIIVTVYNSEKYLKECLNSIKIQTYKNLEVLIIDDGSADKSLEIEAEFENKDKRFKVKKTKHLGSWNARNVGLKMAKGKLLMFVDSDDTIERQTVEMMQKALINTGSDMTVCTYKEVSKNGTLIREHHWPESNVISANDYYKLLCDIETVINATVSWGKLYKKELFKDLQFPNVYCGQDAHLIHYIAKRCDLICLIDQSLYNYRVHENATSRQRGIGTLDENIPFLERADFFMNIGEKKLAEQTMKIAMDNYIVNEMLVEEKDDKYKALSTLMRNKIVQKAKEIGSTNKEFLIKTKFFKDSLLYSYFLKKSEGLFRRIKRKLKKKK